jgi:hypothetical protein
MFRLLFGILLGAGLVYLLDSRQLEGRREMLKDRLHRGKAGEISDRAEGAYQAGRDTFVDAKERAKATAGHAAERARETLDEAKAEAQEWADASRERAESTVNGTPKKR